MMSIFEVATRRKYRFQLNGSLTTEDLWDLSPENLDKIFKGLNTQLKKSSEESLLATRTKEDEDLLHKIEIVKYIVAVKLAEKEAAQAAKARKEQKQKLMALIEEKQTENLKNMPLEQLEAMLKGMEG